jgi:hypothetical protein
MLARFELFNDQTFYQNNLGTNPFLQFIILFILIYFNISFSIDTRPVTKLVAALRDSSSVNKLFKIVNTFLV